MGIGSMVLLFLTAAAIGVIAALLVRRGSRKQYEQIEKQNRTANSISPNHIQDLILPNNMGRAIEEVAATLKKENINPQFHVDCFPERQDTK